MRHLDAAGAGFLGDLEDPFEVLLGQVPLTDARAGGRRKPKAVGILIPDRAGDQRAQDAELLYLQAVIACRRQLQRVDRLDAIWLEADQKQGRQRAAEILQDDALPLCEEDSVTVKGYGVAGSLGCDRELPMREGCSWALWAAATARMEATTSAVEEP